MPTSELQLQSAVDLNLFEEIVDAQHVLAQPGSPVLPTKIFYDDVLSERYEANIWCASELHQPIGAYKIRGAYNFIQSLSAEEQTSGIVTSSAGNHGRAIALVTSLLSINCHIFMPRETPEQKVQGVISDGGHTTEITLQGSTYDECEVTAQEYCQTTGAVFVHPFNDRKIIAGQGTLGQEIVEELPDLDAVFCPVGGSGLIAGVATAIKYHNPDTEIIGVEPAGAASMQSAIRHGTPTPLENIDTFVDGAAVRKVGAIPFAIARPLLSRVVAVSNLDLRRDATDLRERGCAVELAGALASSGLRQDAASLIGKNVLYIQSGGNLSQERYETEVRLMAQLT
jgi:threonine dehydratase